MKISWVLLLIVCLMPQTALAASGTPNSNSFGYGVHIDLQGLDPHVAIQEAGKFNLDWIAIDFNWQYWQSNAENPPAWQDLDTAMALAAENQLAVMISITQAPLWAMDYDGPNSDQTGKLVLNLVHRYSDTLLAIEIFPSANTIQGWGATPNPKAYTRMLRAISKTIGRSSPEVLIVGAGLTPIVSSSEGMDDLDFLSQIYAEGIAEFMPLVGLRLPPLGSDPLARMHPTGTFTLRHYEEIRDIMAENGHKNGLIWITGFSWKADTIGSPDKQAAWMKQAYLLFRSQLYIGVAFFDGLNQSQSEAPVLLLQGGGYHPGFEELIQIIAQDHNEQTIILSIRLFKRLANKNYLKVHTP
jgi:hypothetical protein